MLIMWNRAAVVLVSSIILAALQYSEAEIIAGYQPASLVTDQAAIDLDQRLLRSLLADGNFTQASLVYNNGAHSRAYAIITLEKGTGKINQNTAFLGTTMSGKPIRLYAYNDYEAGAMEIKLLYATSDVQQEYSFCQVGANTEPVYHGCLTALGTITLDGIKSTPLSYSYNPETDNRNGRTLAGFSTAAEEKMAKCGPSCPYSDYAKYLNFYGEYDYAHQYVMAALERRLTTFANGNVDFSTYSLPALEQAIHIATLNLNLWMYVIREYEDGLDGCVQGCVSDQCNTEKVNAWDEGIAFYTGSLEGDDGSGHGILSYALADELCTEFKTCGKDVQETSGRSFVNNEIFRLSNPAVELLMAEKCEETSIFVKKIVGLMTVTLVQGLLRSIYKTNASSSVVDASAIDIARGEAAAYAAAVVPILNNCSASDAEFVFRQLEYNNDNKRDYAAIKEVLERHYECMGVTCEQVGGLWDPQMMRYRSDASPCSTPGDDNVNLGLILGLTFGGVALCALVILAVVRYRKRGDQEVESFIKM